MESNKMKNSDVIYYKKKEVEEKMFNLLRADGKRPHKGTKAREEYNKLDIEASNLLIEFINALNREQH